jgi:anti-anti-sigma factor
MTDTLRPAERPMLIELAGEIDMASANTIGDCLCHAIDLNRSGLVVDMTAVTFIDASSMAMMVRVHQAAARQQSTVTWRGIQPFPAAALAATGLDQVLVFDG